MRSGRLALALLLLPFGSFGGRPASADEGDGEPEPFHRAPDPAATTGPDAELFRKGIEAQADGKYRAARRLFWKLVDDYPDSPFRSEAEDRSGDRGGGNAFLGYSAMGPVGPSARRIDVALMGDGYLLDKQERYDEHAIGELDLLIREPTYGEYRSYFNFWRFNLASKDTGVDEVEKAPPDDELEQRKQKRVKKRRAPRQFETALDCKAAGPQGQVMSNPGCVYHYLSYLDVNDGLAICFAQLGQLGMGGGGIATTGPRGVVVHEFGHAFSWLLDEYAINPDPPAGGVEAANATTFKERPPWQHFLDAKVPKVGIFEGGATFQKGVWRPAASCAMNSGGGDPYCPVCREATILMIYSYVSPIDDVLPAEAEVRKGPQGWPEILVVPMEPAGHDLVVTWRLGAAKSVTATRPDEALPDPSAIPEPPYDEDEGLTAEERRLRKKMREGGKSEPDPDPAPDLDPDPYVDPIPDIDPTPGVGEPGTPDPDGPKAVKPPPAPFPFRIGLFRRTSGTANDPPPKGQVLKGHKTKTEEGQAAVAPVLPVDLAPGRYDLTVTVRDTTRIKGERFPWVLKDDKGLLEDRHTWTLVVPDQLPAVPSVPGR